MSSGIAFLTLLLSVSPVVAECPEVQALTPGPSSPHVRIVVLNQGEPVAKVRVAIVPWRRSPADRLPLFFIASQKGVVELSGLPAGDYHIVASGPEKLTADMDVRVETSRKGRTAFRMALGRSISSALWLPEEHRAPQPIPQFSGIVRDETGAAVPGASVQIWKAGLETKPPLAGSVSDQVGRFFLSVPDGEYVALFESPGFQRELVPIHVAKDAALARFAVVLHLGRC